MNKEHYNNLQDFRMIIKTDRKTIIYENKKAFEIKEFLKNSKLEDFNKITIEKYNFVNKEIKQ